MKQEKSVYVVLSDTGSLLTKTIKVFTRAPYNHVSISFDPELKQLYSFGRKTANNPFSGGFVVENIDRGTFKKFHKTQCLVLKTKVDASSHQLLKERVASFVENEEKYHYNFIGLIGVLFKRRISRKNGYYCSHFVAETFEHANLLDGSTPPFLVKPYDFTQMLGLSPVYEGLLKEYETC